MPRIKGTDVVSLRAFVQEKGPQEEGLFLERLPDALRKVFVETSTVTWNPVEVQAELYEVAAAYLFPNQPSPVVEMHKALARRSYSGVYKVFVRIPTLAFIATRAASMWRSYYDTGEAAVENSTGISLDFVVRQFPGLPRAMREATTGHLSTILEMSRVKTPVIMPPPNHPEAWVWHLIWT